MTLSATNSAGTGSATLTLTIALATPAITSATTASGTVGSAFSYQIAATNAPASYGATGLPAGLSVSTTAGLISGTPTAGRDSTVTLSATNSAGTGSATLTLTIERKGRREVPATSNSSGLSVVQPLNTVTNLFCTPQIIPAGSQATCELRVTATSEATAIQVTSSSEQVKIPSVVLTRANQTRLTFQVATDPAAGGQLATITAMAGTSTAQETIQLQASSGPVLTVPNAQTARLGKTLRFTVSAVDPNELPVQLSASEVPAGASFDAASGLFEWIPSASQKGNYKVVFGATNSVGQSSSAEITVSVSSGVPSVASELLTCSPGAIASLNGSGFAEPRSALSDPSGQSMVLGNTKVKINDQYVSVLAASDARVTFLCPALDPDTPLAATVETDTGVSEPLRATMRTATPMILSLDGSGQNQGVITLAETTDLAMGRNYQVPAHPAQPGDEILIWASGLGVPSEVPAGTVLVEVGGVAAKVESVRAVPGYAGVSTIQACVPAVMDFSDAVPVQVRVNTLGGKQLNSNQVTMAVEPVSQ